MRIISGTARGIVLTVPKGLAVRPTADRARKALFDSIGIFSGKVAVDMFAGCGALGLEAASRSADQVFFIEKSPHHCAIIRENILKVAKAGVDSTMEILQGDVLRFPFSVKIPNPGIVFADPPYKISRRCFLSIIENELFFSWIGAAPLVWEIPESESPQTWLDNEKKWRIESFRNFGGLQFGIFKTIPA